MIKAKKQTIFYTLLVASIFVGIAIQLLLIEIDYSQMLNINIFDSMTISIIFKMFTPLYKSGFTGLLAAFVLIICVIALKLTKFKEYMQDNELNLLNTLFLSLILIALSQIILPLMITTVIISFVILYFLFGTSYVFQYMLRVILQIFLDALQYFFMISDHDINLGNFIGQEYVSLLLTLTISFISLPYLFPPILFLVKNFFSKCTGANAIIDLVFRPIEFVFQLTNTRYYIYIILFLLSIVVYSYNVSNSANILILIKESLLAFVLLDTVFYSVYDNHNKRKKQKYSRIYMEQILPYKFDLEYIRSVMTTYSLKSNYIEKAKIIFSKDISTLNINKKLPFYNIVIQIQSLNGKYMPYRDLYKKINEILSAIYQYESNI